MITFIWEKSYFIIQFPWKTVIHKDLHGKIVVVYSYHNIIPWNLNLYRMKYIILWDISVPYFVEFYKIKFFVLILYIKIDQI